MVSGPSHREIGPDAPRHAVIVVRRDAGVRHLSDIPARFPCWRRVCMAGNRRGSQLGKQCQHRVLGRVEGDCQRIGDGSPPGDQLGAKLAYNGRPFDRSSMSRRMPRPLLVMPVGRRRSYVPGRLRVPDLRAWPC